MAWDYAEHSKEVKGAGGVNQYIDNLTETGKELGREEMIPWLFISSIGSAVLTWGFTKIVDYFKARRAKSQKAVDEAKEKLAEEIKKYDVEQTNATTNMIESAESENVIIDEENSDGTV